jgi:hypothetical protein
MRRVLGPLGLVLPLALTGAGATAAHAEDCTGPCIAYALDYEAFGNVLNSGNGWYYDIYPSLETEVSLQTGEGIALNLDVIVEPVKDPVPDENRAFGDIGAYFKTLNLSYETDDYSVLLGQFEPNFGRAWDVAPGLYGSFLAEDYEFTDRLGAEASYFFNAGGFHNQATASVFTLDRSFLSGSLGTSRGSNNINDGGAGNTNGLSSVALTLTGCQGTDPDACYDDGKMGYQVGLLFQSEGQGDYGNETGIVGSLNKTIKTGDEQDVKLLGEVAYFNNFEGTDSDVLYATASAAYDISDYTLSLTGTERVGLNHQDDDQTFVDASAVYNLGDAVSIAGEAWSVGVSYDYNHAPDETTNSVALQVKAELEGNAELK